ncbi:hypothetical protein SPI_06890 [Niveomyces insectorum RCEF 264]|uniref:Uncharacterized protein n=1 Tax=Niveomyces insectorum RCEF 264 TaxID=1081102 RepID=A0A167QVH3_9HYPO|nr:hypothetical protein SPI_06890 [Niveomyces insectorum RCEF 264]
MFESQLPMRQRSLEPSQVYSHSRTRTTSSNVFPSATAAAAGAPAPPQPPPPPPMQLANPSISHNNRSSSVNTFSTMSSLGMAPPAAYRTSPTNDIRRSTSSRSGGAGGSITTYAQQQTSYVALLRRQKATVWSERAQFEDPRFAAQQRAARMRANREIVGSGGAYVGGGGGGGRTSTGMSSAGGKVAAKIRHHGSKTSAMGYGADSNYVGIGGVPLRLSATEVEGEDSDEDDTAATARPNHRRTGSSGRSSTASGRRSVPFRSSTGALVPSGSNSLQGGVRRWSPGDTPERAGSFAAGEPSGAVGGVERDDAASGRARSTANGSA